MKLIQRAIDEERALRNPNPVEETSEPQNGMWQVNSVMSGTTQESNTEQSQTDSQSSGLMGLRKDDPILAFISGMDDMKPKVNEKYLKKQKKRREKQREQDEKNRITVETQNRERDEETAVINEKVKELHLRVKPVDADGNCLYVVVPMLYLKISCCSGAISPS